MFTKGGWRERIRLFFACRDNYRGLSFVNYFYKNKMTSQPAHKEKFNEGEMKIELSNGLGTVYTSTQDVETTNLVMSLQPPTPIKLSDFEPKLCKNCKYWERNVKEEDYDDEFDTMDGDEYGKCKSECFLYYKEWGDHGKKLNGNNNELFYTDYEQYRAWFVTGENFGCIHFEGKC